MARINLVIADSDENYLSGLMNYFIEYYSDKLQIDCFTNQECLKEYLNQNRNIDLLLLTSEMYYEEISDSLKKSIAMLSTGRLSAEFSNIPILLKFQNGEKLFSDIMNLYSEKNPNMIINTKQGNNSTKVIAVYSPVGGSGKTSVALSSCMHLADMGKSVLYLNLENFQTSSLYLDCSNDRNLSQLFHYVKQRNMNINDKFLSIRCHDEKSGIDYVCPPDNINDIDEMDTEDMSYLLTNLKALNQYDYIFVDMSSTFNDVSKHMMMESDKIYLIMGQDKTSAIKIELLLKQYDFKEKSYFIVNNHRKELAIEADGVLADANLKADYLLPRDKTLIVDQGLKDSLTGNNKFSLGIVDIISHTL